MSDAFLEVQEQIRQERLAQLWQRWGNALITFVLAVVLITAGFSIYNHFERQTRLDQTNQLYALMNDASFPDNLADAAEDTMSPAMHALLKLRAAKAALDGGMDDVAIAYYRDVSVLDGEAAAPYRGLAKIMVARLAPEETAAILQPIAQDADNMWRGHALLDLAAYEASTLKNYDAALGYVQTLQTLPNISPSLVNKAQALEHVYTQLKDQ